MSDLPFRVVCPDSDYKLPISAKGAERLKKQFETGNTKVGVCELEHTIEEVSDADVRTE